MLGQPFWRQWMQQQVLQQFLQPHLSQVYWERPNTQFWQCPCPLAFPNICGPHLGLQPQHRASQVRMWHTWEGSLWPNELLLLPLLFVLPFSSHIQLFPMTAWSWCTPLESWTSHCLLHHNNLHLNPPAIQSFDTVRHFLLQLNQMKFMIVSISTLLNVYHLIVCCNIINRYEVNVYQFNYQYILIIRPVWVHINKTVIIIMQPPL